MWTVTYNPGSTHDTYYISECLECSLIVYIPNTIIGESSQILKDTLRENTDKDIFYWRYLILRCHCLLPSHILGQLAATLQTESTYSFSQNSASLFFFCKKPGSQFYPMPWSIKFPAVTSPA